MTNALTNAAPLFLFVSEADAKSAGGTGGLPKGGASPLPPKGFRWQGPTGPEEIQAAYAAKGLAGAIRAWAQAHWAPLRNDLTYPPSRADNARADSTVMFRLWAMAPAIASAVAKAPRPGQ